MPYHPNFNLKEFISNALKEDIGDGDHTTDACIPANAKGEARLLVKEKGIIAGVHLAQEILHTVNPRLKIKTFINDGDAVKKGDVVFVVQGNISSILISERLVLNCMQRMSGIATKTNLIAQKLKSTKTKLLDTRKTTPGFRAMEKYAVQIGGGINHRFGLYDMILIKDNHNDFAGGLENAIRAAKVYVSKHNKKLKIEVEARNINEVKSILALKMVDRIMLDNFTISELKKAIKLIDHKIVTEASGNITTKNILAYAKCGVDYISVGALTHSYTSLDLSLKATHTY